MYRQLDRENQEIRLIRLVEEEPPAGAAWVFEMRHVPLEAQELNNASALSYVWGKYDDKAKHVSINNQLIKITANLHSAICAFANHEDLRRSWWWIDAVCINQADIDERGFQVSLMKKLYSRSDRTVAFLGSGTEGKIAKGLSWLMRLDDVRQTQADKLSWITEAVKNPELEDNWKSLGEVFRKEWWERAWILQESVVSPTLLFLSEDVLIPEPTMWGALFYIRVCQSNIRDTLVRLDVGIDGWSHYFLGIYNRLQLRPTFAKKKEISFRDLLDLRLDFHATDPRDYVYGLFALTGSLVELMPTPNHSAPIWEVYASWMMTWAFTRENLDILTLGGWPRGSVDLLPSWVPDLSQRNGPGLPFLSSDCMFHMNLTFQENYQRLVENAKKDPSVDVPDQKKAAYRATGSLKIQCDLMHDDERIMQCWGILVDTIDGMAGTQGLVRCEGEDNLRTRHNHGLMIPNRQPTGTSTAYGSTEQTKAAIWRSLIMDRIGLSPCEPAPDFGGVLFAKECMEIENGKGDPGWKDLWGIIHDFKIGGRTLLDWFHGDLSELRVQAWEATSKYYQRLDQNGSFARPKNPVIDRSKHILCEMQRHLCVTHEGYVGMLTTNAEPGDEVWVLLGCNIPVVLRKRNDGKRTLVGECYLHGIMYGEAVKDVEEGCKEAVPCLIA